MSKSGNFWRFARLNFVPTSFWEEVKIEEI